MENVVTITDGELRLSSNLGEYAFGMCSSLESINIPDGVEIIER